MEIAMTDLNVLYEKGNIFGHLAKDYDYQFFYRYSIQSHSFILLLYMLKYNHLLYDSTSLSIIHNGSFIQDIEALGGFPDASKIIMQYFRDAKKHVMVADNDIEYFKARTEYLQEEHGMIWTNYVPIVQQGGDKYNIHFFQKLT